MALSGKNVGPATKRAVVMQPIVGREKHRIKRYCKPPLSKRGFMTLPFVCTYDNTDEPHQPCVQDSPLYDHKDSPRWTTLQGAAPHFPRRGTSRELTIITVTLR